MSIDFRDLNGYRQLPGQSSSADAARDAAMDRKATDAREAGADEAAAGESPAGKVNLSSSARNLRSLAEAAQSSEGIDAARVERIRAEIAAGRYHVDADKLADRMIDLERALLD